MKRVKVFKNGVQTHGAEFVDPTAWVAEQIEANAWGKPDRWLFELEALAQGEDLTRAIETADELDPLTQEPVKKYRFAPEYTVEVSDITAEFTAKETKKAELKALFKNLRDFLKKASPTAAERNQAFGDLLKIYLRLMNEEVGD